MTAPATEVTDICSVRQTHVSILLFLGEHVFKLRKPLRFDFADFSSLSARADDCRREVDLNRRLAPDVYLGVADITMEGQTLDHLVVMRRLPTDRSLAHLVHSEPEAVWSRRAPGRGQAPGGLPRSSRPIGADFGHRLAAHHQRSIRDERGGDGTLCRLGARSERSRPPWWARSDATWQGRDPLFTARIAADQICDGHGDLQADDIYCLEDGPRILDCLEFDERLRCGDVAADVAFLAMDLERLGNTEAAARFVSDYEESSGAQLPPSLLHTYIALRAYVRIKVACVRHEQGDPDAAEDAAGLLDLAQAHLERGRVHLVLVGGLPGSGKSTLANALGEALGAIVLRSDEFRGGRSDAAHHAVSTTFRRGRYAPHRTRQVYDELISAARQHLGLGQSVVVDALVGRRVEPGPGPGTRLRVIGRPDRTALRSPP